MSRIPGCVKPLFWGALCLGLLAGGLVEAQSSRWRRLRSSEGLKVQVQAPTRLRFFVRRDAGGRPFLAGTLTDDRGKGIANASLSIRLPGGATHKVQSSDKGAFSKAAVAWPRRGVYQVSFEGRGRFASALQSRQLDLSRVDIQIKARFPAPLETGSKRFEIRAQLSYKGRPLEGFPLSLLLEKPGSSSKSKVQTLWPLMTLRSDGLGEIRFVWEGKALKGPATLPLVLAYPGNDFFLAQKYRHTLIVLAPPHDGQGQWWWSLLLGLVVLSIVGVGGAWVGVLYLRKLRDDRKIHHQPRSRPGAKPPPPPPGVELPLQQDGFLLGYCLDDDENAPVEGAYLVLISEIELDLEAEDEAEPPQTQSDNWGRFALEVGEREGPIKMRVFHPHFRAKSLQVKLPYQGKALRVPLSSYRHLIFQSFVKAAQQVAPEQAFNPRERTARELVSALDDARAGKLEPMVALFEQTYYGPHMPEAARYTEAAELLQAIAPPPKTPEARATVRPEQPPASRSLPENTASSETRG